MPLGLGTGLGLSVPLYAAQPATPPGPIIEKFASAGLLASTAISAQGTMEYPAPADWSDWDGSLDGAAKNVLTRGDIRGHNAVAINGSEAAIFYRDTAGAGVPGKVEILDIDLDAKEASDGNPVLPLSILEPSAPHIFRLSDDRLVALAWSLTDGKYYASLLSKSGKNLTELDVLDLGTTAGVFSRHTGCQLNESQVAHLYPNGSNNGVLRVLSAANDTLSVGPDLALNSAMDRYGSGVARLTDATLAVATNVDAYHVTVVGDTPSTDSTLSIMSGGVVGTTKVARLADDQFAVSLHNADDLRLSTFTYGAGSLSRAADGQPIADGTDLFVAYAMVPDLSPGVAMFGFSDSLDGGRAFAWHVSFDAAANITGTFSKEIADAGLAEHVTLSAPPQRSYIINCYQDEDDTPDRQLGTRVLIPGRFVWESHLSGSAALSASAAVEKPASAALSGSATVSASALRVLPGAAALSGSATVSASAIVDLPQQGSAPLTGSATLSAAAKTTSLASSSLTGSAALSGSAAVVKTASTALSGSATVSASSNVETPVSGGDTLYVAGFQQDTVFQYNMGGTWDLSGAAYASKSGDVSNHGVDTYQIGFSPDGQKLFALSQNAEVLGEYSLGTPWDISTIAASPTATLDLSAIPANPRSFAFNSDGTKLWVGGNPDGVPATIFRFGLSAAYSLSGGSYDSVSHDVSDVVGTPTIVQDIQFSATGDKLWLLAVANDSSVTVHQMDLSTPYDPTSETYSGVLFDAIGNGTWGFHVNPAGDKLFLVVFGGGADSVEQYTLTTPGNISTAIADGVSLYVGAQEGFPTTLTFDK